MKGEQHVFYTLLSLAVLLPLILAGFLSSGYTTLTALIVFTAGVFIGSLAPDADAADSAIMHGLAGGKGTVRTARRHTVIILPFFGYLIRYLIYYPISALVFIFSLGRIKPRHRGLLHSLFGTLAAALILAIYLRLITDILLAAIFAAEVTAAIDSYLPAFCAGILFGAVMHLIEDSCTHEGVYWLFPFSSVKLSGNLTPKGRRNWLIVVTLGIAAIISLTFGNTYRINGITGINLTESITADITTDITLAAASTVTPEMIPYLIMPIIYLAAAWITAFYISGTHRG
ncbi:metal-dependent hydrolase [Methanomicrobium mobile]|uniref:metal-dependent hydrolase n=1 Tax=Methanomicrobium mobile TaxID=2205 RepID=UPI0005B28CF2|nr:metal-dependent hydrolase [Methanomicrobium mobile]